MAGFTGILPTNSYAGFENIYGPARSKPGPIIEVACWRHKHQRTMLRKIVPSPRISNFDPGSRINVCSRGFTVSLRCEPPCLAGVIEPPRDSRRLFGLSYAAMGMVSCIA